MALTFIDTNQLPRLKTPQGEATEVLNQQLAGAKNVLGTLRWLNAGEKFAAEATDKHQLIYLMDGEASINLEQRDYAVKKGAGVYLGPQEAATITAAPDSSAKLFHLVVPQIPR
jgi:quercetin dioxygenase-like cupin family protein